MSRHSFGSGFGRGQRRLAVEHLERRAMLAGNVNVFVDGAGNMIVRGDGGDNFVLISQVDHNAYTVTGLDFGDFEGSEEFGFDSGETVIKGGTETGEDNVRLFTGVKGDINVDLKKGDDLLAVGNSVEDLFALAEDCGLGFGFGSGSASEGGGNGSGSGSNNGSHSPETIVAQQVEGTMFIPRNLIAVMGDGNDGVVVNANIHRSVVINTGNGIGAVAVGAPDFGDSIGIGDDLVIVNGKQEDFVCVHNAEIHDTLSVATGEGSDAVFAEDFGARQAVIATAGGEDEVEMVFFGLDGKLVVDTGNHDDNVLIDDFNAGNVTVATGNGNDNAEVFDFEVNNLVVDTGPGNDGTPNERSPITVEDGSITHNLVVATGAGDDLLEVENIEARNITVDTGPGNDGSADFEGEIGFFGFPIAVYNVDVEQNLVVATGAGRDIVYIYSGDGEGPISNIGLNLILDTGPQDDFALVLDQIVGNDMKVLLGAGNDLGLIGSTEGFPGQEFPGTEIGSLDVHHNLLVDAGAGNDAVGIGNVNVDNDAFLLLGAGNDLLFVDNVDVDRNSLIDAGAGHDEVTIENDSNVRGTATILMGAGADTLNIFNSSARKLIARGGSGTDTFNNDLGIEANGKTDDTDVKEFENFSDLD